MEDVKTTAQADSFEQHKAIRSGAAVPATEPVQAEPPIEPTPSEQPEPEGSETAEVSETSPSQEKPRRDRSAEGRIAELTARAKRAEEELAEIRRKLDQPQAPSKPAAEPEPSSKAIVEDPKDPAPKLEDYGDKPYEAFLDARAAWQARQEYRRLQQEERSRAQQDGLLKRIQEQRVKRPDFDQVANIPKLDQSVLSSLVQEFDNGFDVLYELGSNPAEAQRISALSPARQLAAVGMIAERLLAPPPEKPIVPAPPVSRVPPPPRVVGGTEPAQPKSTAEARSFDEHKRLRSQR